MIGDSLGHYRILRRVAVGGMGEVYEAEDERLGRRVALKVLPLELAADAERRVRFVREARALAALNHPHIVTIHSVDEVDGVHFLTMELLEGPTLADVISTGGLPVLRLLDLAVPLAAGVAAAPDLTQEVRFCAAADGVRLAYATVGSGPPLVKAANWLNHLEHDWESPYWRPTFRELARDHSLVRYDARGSGLSDWDVETLDFDGFVSDLMAVVDAAGLERFALLGISQGCAVSIAFAVRHPERVSRLILHGGFAVGWRLRDDPEEVGRREAMGKLIRYGWGQENPAFREMFTATYIPDSTSDQRDSFTELQRISASPANAERFWEAVGRIDVRDLLPKVEVPTLVLHCRGDQAVPFPAGRQLATTIPGARFVALDSRNHLILEQEPAWSRFIAEVKGFVAVE